MDGMARRQAAGRQGPDSRHHRFIDKLRRASRTGGSADRALRQCGRARARHRRHRLRVRNLCGLWEGRSGGRLQEVALTGRRGGNRIQAAVELRAADACDYLQKIGRGCATHFPLDSLKSKTTSLRQCAVMRFRRSICTNLTVNHKADRPRELFAKFQGPTGHSYMRRTSSMKMDVIYEKDVIYYSTVGWVERSETHHFDPMMGFARRSQAQPICKSGRHLWEKRHLCAGLCPRTDFMSPAFA